MSSFPPAKWEVRQLKDLEAESKLGWLARIVLWNLREWKKEISSGASVRSVVREAITEHANDRPTEIPCLSHLANG